MALPNLFPKLNIFSIDSLRKRNEELLEQKQEFKTLEETLQQKEIDISVLRGQVQRALDDLESCSCSNGDSDSDTLTFVASEGDEDEIFVDEIELLEAEK